MDYEAGIVRKIYKSKLIKRQNYYDKRQKNE